MRNPNKDMLKPTIYKKNAEITPLQERLLDFFDPNSLDFNNRFQSYEWIYDAIIFDYQQDLTLENRMHIFDLKQVIDILKGLAMGY